MPRLIDAYKVRIDRDDFDTYSDYITALDAVTEAPTMDAVPVIRCKDCKFRDPENKKCDCGHGIIWRLPRDDDWFCADAERKEE